MQRAMAFLQVLMIVPIEPCTQPSRLCGVTVVALACMATELSAVLSSDRCDVQGQLPDAAHLLISYIIWLLIIVGHGLRLRAS